MVLDAPEGGEGHRAHRNHEARLHKLDRAGKERRAVAYLAGERRPVSAGAVERQAEDGIRHEHVVTFESGFVKQQFETAAGFVAVEGHARAASPPPSRRLAHEEPVEATAAASAINHRTTRLHAGTVPAGQCIRGQLLAVVAKLRNRRRGRHPRAHGSARPLPPPPGSRSG